MTPHLEVLGSLVRDLQHGMSQLFYLMLPVGILLSVIANYLKSGNADYNDIIKRAFVASLLLTMFPEISNMILDVCDGIAAKLDNMSGLETFLRMAQERSHSYANSKNVLILKFDDLFMAALSFGSLAILLIARYITVALYYFYWTLLSILSPLMILCYLFPQTANVTTNLFKGLIEVACWKILWAVLSAMLRSVAFGDMYKTDGTYLTMIIMNFVIAIALLFTPMIVKSLIGTGVQSSAQSIGTTATIMMTTLPSKLASAKGAVAQHYQKYHGKIQAGQFNNTKNGGSNE